MINTNSFMISCRKFKLYRQKIRTQVENSKRNTLPPLPKCFFNLPPRIWVARDQLRPGSFLPRRKSLGTRLIKTEEITIRWYENQSVLLEGPLTEKYRKILERIASISPDSESNLGVGNVEDSTDNPF